MAHSYPDWLAMAPEDFKDEIMHRLDNPPGIPGEKSVHGDEGWYDMLADRGSVEIDTHGTASRNDSKRKKQSANSWGKYAEAVTARKLLIEGYVLREHNWRPGPGARGEIDLICQKGNRIVFVEVKARMGNVCSAWEAITPQKISDLCHGADAYLKRQKEMFEYQFDVALLTGSPADFTLEYISDAFLCPLGRSR